MTNFKFLKCLVSVYLLCIYSFVMGSSNSYSSLNNTVIPNNIVYDNKPDPLIDDYLSTNGPDISLDDLIKQNNQIKSGSDTYTYVRCYYALNSYNTLSMDTLSPKSNYIWAKQGGEYYKLPGYWYKSSLFAWKNMFYTSISLSRIKQICDDTVTRETNSNFSFDQYAADNRLSFNHAIWQNDDINDMGDNINKVISFGDSLTDTNNMYNASQWRLPNNKSWFQGRFSNGRVWTEYLSQDLGIPLYNWAIGGAAGDSQYLILSGLKQEVNSWVDYMAFAKNYNPRRSLFTILIGANDILNYNRSVENIIQDLKDSLAILAQHGAKNILLLNLPDLSVVPVFHMGTQVGDVKQQVIDYNNNIPKVVSELKQRFPQLDIYVFDTYKLFNDALQDYNSYGLTNIFDPCLNINKDTALSYIQDHLPRASCLRASQFMFWDGMHITTKVHRVLADKVRESIVDHYNN